MGDTTNHTDDEHEAEGEHEAQDEGEGEHEGEREAEGEHDAAPEVAGPAAKKKSMGAMVGILGFLAALAGGFAVGQCINRGSDDAFAEVESGPRLKVRLRGDEPQIGPDDALVTIIEFADYQCPYCQQASPPVMKAVEKYDGKVRIIYKHLPLPFHKAALPAAKAAWAAAQQGAFWPVHEALFVAKGSLADLDGLIAKHNLDAAKFKADMASPAAAQSIDDDMKAAAVLGISGTPAFVVNGHHYRGKREFDQWKQILEAEIDAAEQVVDGGVARADVYAHLMKSALEKHTPPPTADDDGPDPTVRYQVKPDGRPALGPADALVTIVLFSDFQCPYCSKMAPVAHQLVERHPDVRFVFRNLPLSMHKHARPAALAAVAAGRQGKFWEMHDKLFAEQKEIPDAVDDDFADWADDLGLDVEQFKTDFQSPEVAREVQEDQAVAGRFAVRGTPGSFVNGKFVSGALDADGFDAIIATERAAAQALVEQGTPRDQVLDALLADALQRVMPNKAAAADKSPQK